jgi:GxxExxY protein
VYYHDAVVGEYFVDLLVEDVLLVELKTVKALDDVHMPPGARPGGRMQCINYLKATDRQLCLLLSFGNSRLEIKRVAHDL